MHVMFLREKMSIFSCAAKIKTTEYLYFSLCKYWSLLCFCVAGDRLRTGPTSSKYNNHNRCITSPAPAAVTGGPLASKCWKSSSLTGWSTLWKVELKDGIFTIVFIAVAVQRPFWGIFSILLGIILRFPLQRGRGNQWLLHFHWMVCTAWIFKRISNSHHSVCSGVTLSLMPVSECDFSVIVWLRLHLHGVSESWNIRIFFYSERTREDTKK